MNEITNNEMSFVLSIFKSLGIEYNANNIAKHIGITRMGALKIAKRLENENVISSKELGKAKFYRLNLGSDYVGQYVKFLLKREAEQAQPYVKVWIDDLKKMRNAEAAILFGSVLRKGKQANDIDVLLIVKDKKQFSGLKKEIAEINMMHSKKVHPMFQTRQDFKDNIKKLDKPLLNAIKGIVVFGEDNIMELMQK